MSKKYEVIVVLNADLDEQGVRNQLDKISAILEAHQGSVLREEQLGRQQLSYPMEKQTSGIYVILVVEALPTFVAEFTRQMRITDEVLRFSCVKKDKFAPDFVKREERSRDSKGKPRSDKKDEKSSKADDKDSQDGKADTDSKESAAASA